jgi:hypothetical protein
MSIHLKRTVLFFCILCLGLSCCLGYLGMAQAETTWIATMLKEHAQLRVVSGIVTCNGSGFEDVKIYDGDKLLGVTNSQGFYSAKITRGLPTTITPKNIGYQFTPPSLVIPEDQYDHVDQNFSSYSHTISGKVTYSGKGLEDVGIYDNNIQVAVTDINGNYKAEVCSGTDFTLAPKKSGFQFDPPFRLISVNQYDQINQDFTAQKALIINGNVKWKNSSGDTTISSNPLSKVAMEARAQDGSLFYQIFTDFDGNYSIPVPVGWKGSVEPVRFGFEFFPPKMSYSNLSTNQSQDYYAPHLIDYRVTVSVKKPDGSKLPINEHVRIDFRGIDHATGSHDYTYMDRSTGQAVWDFHSGWIGEITPSNHQPLGEGPILYNFNPASIRMSAPIASDMTFSFTATPQ